MICIQYFAALVIFYSAQAVAVAVPQKYEINGRKFWISNLGNGTWEEGRAACGSEGGDLAVFDTKEMLGSVTRTLGLDEKHWIGLHDQEQEGIFRWVNGAAMSFNAWRNENPNGQSNKNCIVVSPINRFHDKRCDLGWPSLCSDKAPNCTSAVDGCVLDSRGITESNELLLSERLGPATWYDANATCEWNRTSLLTIRNPAKHGALMTVLGIDEEVDVWIGLEDSALESMFRWASDGYLATWVNWDDGQPNGTAGDERGVEDCVKRCRSDGKWHDTDCNELLYFYCEVVTPACDGVFRGDSKITDNTTDTCFHVPTTKPTKEQVLFTLKPGDGCINNDRVKVEINVGDSLSGGQCNMLRMFFYTDGHDCCLNSLRSCTVLNPDDSGPECHLQCKCFNGGCTISFVNTPFLGNPIALQICDANFI